MGPLILCLLLTLLSPFQAWKPLKGGAQDSGMVLELPTKGRH